MKRNLTITCLFIQTVIVSLLFATTFVTKPASFQHLIAAKQWGMELGMLIAIFFLVLYIPVVKKIKITTTDLGILSLSLWWIVRKIVFPNTFQPLQLAVFMYCYGLQVICFFAVLRTVGNIIKPYKLPGKYLKVL